MKTEQLRIGNAVARIDQPETYSVIIALETGGAVHLYDAQHPEDIRDIIGILLTPILMEQIGYSSQFTFHERNFHLQFVRGRAELNIDTTFTIVIKYLHELQNLVFLVTGGELLDPYELTQS